MGRSLIFGINLKINKSINRENLRKEEIGMGRVKVLTIFILISLLLFSFTYAFPRNRFRAQVIPPRITSKPIQISQDIRKLIMERNKVWFELRELLRDKQLNLSKIEEKARELQKLEEEISNKIQENILERLSKDLNLTKEQESSIKNIFERYREKLETLRKDLRDIKKQLIEEIKKILTEEQKKKFDKYLKPIYPWGRLWIGK